MLLYTLLMSAPLLAMLIAAAFIDIRERRIPNALTLPLLAAGLAQAVLGLGSVTFGQALGGMALGFVIGVLLLALGALGGGDVKLMAGVGACMGIVPTLWVLAIAAIIGMAIVLAQAMRTGQTRLLLGSTAILATELLHGGRAGAMEEAVAEGRRFESMGRPLPFAVPVLLATFATVLGLPILKGVAL